MKTQIQENSTFITMFFMEFKDIILVLTIPAIFLAFFTQQYRIVKRRSSIGLSPFFCLLGTLSTLTSFVNVVILQYPVLKRCNSQTCLRDLIGFSQIMAMTISFLLTWILFLIYYPESWLPPKTDSERLSPEAKDVHNAFGLWMIFIVCTVFILTVVISFNGIESKEAIGVAWTYGVLCTLFSLVQYMPQIWHTWTHRNIGALSMVTLSIQAPGSFFFTYILATSPNTDISTWMGFLLSGMFQIFLLVICAYVKLSGEIEEENTVESVGEREPLVNNDARVAARV